MFHVLLYWSSFVLFKDSIVQMHGLPVFVGAFWLMI